MGQAEYLNPSGAIKARIAKYMIERAEQEGLLAPGDTIVEASSGNAGDAMSMVAAVKGYRMLVVMPNGMSGERLAILRAFGAQAMTRARGDGTTMAGLCWLYAASPCGE
jgi:cysteine synthase A